MTFTNKDSILFNAGEVEINKAVLVTGTVDVNGGTVNVGNLGNLIQVDYDEIVLSYTGSNLTGVVYKKATITVATLTLGYDGSNNLISVVRT